MLLNANTPIKVEEAKVATTRASREARKRPSGFSIRSDTNQPVQLQKMGRCLKFQVFGSRGIVLLYPCIENKGADQLFSDLAFVFGKAKIWFFGNAAKSCNEEYLGVLQLSRL